MEANIYRLQMVRDRSVEYGTINGSGEAVALFRALGIQNEPEEVIAIACRDNRGNICGVHEVSRGTLCNSLVEPREVFKRALLNNAGSIILCHNHPSGETSPSVEDMRITTRLMEAGNILGIPVVDHIILGDDAYYSFGENGFFQKEEKKYA